MNKVIIISALDFSFNSAAKKRIYAIASALRQRDIALDFISLYNGVFDYDDYYKIQKLNGNKTIHFIFLFFSNLKKILKNSNMDVTIYLYPTSSQILEILYILYIKLFTNVKLLIEINEVRNAVRNSQFTNKLTLITKLKKNTLYFWDKIADRFFSLADGHIYISTYIQKYYKKKNSIIVPILSTTYISETKYKCYDHDIMQIGFCGSIDVEKEKMVLFFDGLSKLRTKGYDFRINLYGHIFNQERFEKELIKYNLQKIFIYHGMIQQTELSKRIKEDNHLLILPRGRTKQNLYGFATKLTDYLESQLPIITSRVGDVEKYFINGENSFTYDPDFVDDFVERMQFVIENYNQVVKTVVDNANELNNKVFHYSNFADKLYTFFRN